MSLVLDIGLAGATTIPPANDDYRRNPDHFLRPMRLPRSAPEVASPASEVAWRNGVYVRSGRYPTQEEYREWLVGR